MRTRRKVGQFVSLCRGPRFRVPGLLGERKGAMNSALIEFEDGDCDVSRNALCRAVTRRSVRDDVPVSAQAQTRQ